MLTTHMKMKVYQACVLSTLLNKAWTLYSRQERRLNILHLRCLRRLQGIARQVRVTIKDVLAQAGTSNMFAMVTKRRDCAGWATSLLHGWWPHSKGCFVWWVGDWLQNKRTYSLYCATKTSVSATWGQAASIQRACKQHHQTVSIGGTQ